MTHRTAKPIARLTWSGKVGAAEWQKLATARPASLSCESVSLAAMPEQLSGSVRQISFAGDSSIPEDFFARFPDLRDIRVAGKLAIDPSRQRCAVRKIELTDFAGSAVELLEGFEVERLDVTGQVADLANALAMQPRLCGLSLQETKLELAACESVLPQLEVLCLYRTAQKSYDWMKRLVRLEMLSMARQSNFSGLSMVADLPRLRILDLSSQRKIEDYATLARARNLVLLSFVALGTIPSLRWAKELTRLRVVKILEGCTIADGEIAFLGSMPSLEHVLVEGRSSYDADALTLSKTTALQGLAIWESELPKVWRNSLK